jgi:hypothetical protein
LIARLILFAGVAVAVQAGAVATDAGAFERRVDGTFVLGPVLAGDSVVDAERRGGAERIVRRELAGGPAQTLVELAPRPGSDLVLADLAASPEGFAYGTVEQGQAGGGSAVLGGRFGVEPHGFSGCSGGVASVAVSGATVLNDNCELRLSTLDETGGGTVLTADGMFPRAAEPYVAYLVGSFRRPDVVVYDLRTRQEAYRMPGSALPGALRGYTLSSDGTIAVLYSVRRRGRTVVRLAWASPASQRYRRVPLPDAQRLSAAIVGDRVGFVLGPTRGRARQLGVTGLTGGRRIVARGALGPAVDFDGRRLAYTVMRKRRTYLRVVEPRLG